MWKVLGSLGATLAVALVLATAAVTAGAMHSGSKGCATKERCAAGGLAAAVASAPDAVSEATTTGVHDAGDHVDFSFPSAMAVTTVGAPEFGFDVSVQAAGVRFPYLRYPPFPDL